MNAVQDLYMPQARSELDRLCSTLTSSIADGQLSRAKDAAEQISNLLEVGIKLEEIQKKLNEITSQPAPQGRPPVKAATKQRLESRETSPTSNGSTHSTPSLSPPSTPPATNPPSEVQAAPLPTEGLLRIPGRPKILPAQANDEDTLRARRKKLEGSVKAFLDASREAMGEESLTKLEEAQAKSLISHGRALDAESLELKSILRQTIREELLILGEWWDRASSNPEFFGLNPARIHIPAIWEEISTGYRLLADAEDAVAWLESEPAISDAQKQSVMELAACAEAYLLRVFDERGLGVWDGQQKDVHTRLEKLEPSSHVTRWWKRTDAPPMEELRKRGEMLREETTTIRKAKERALVSAAALAEVRDYMADATGKGFDEKALLAKVEAAMLAGVASSNRELRNLLAGYRFILEGSENRDVQKLDQNLQKDALELIAKRRALAEPQMEEEDDPELAAKVLSLLPVTTGKTLMFVGGSKGQGWRKDEYVRILGFKEVIWPDAEEGTKVSDLASKVGKADIVCLLIRFSRHSYKSVLDEAKSQGKMTVTLPRGYSVNTLIHEMASQVL